MCNGNVFDPSGMDEKRRILCRLANDTLLWIFISFAQRWVSRWRWMRRDGIKSFDWFEFYWSFSIGFFSLGITLMPFATSSIQFFSQNIISTSCWQPCSSWVAFPVICSFTPHGKCARSFSFVQVELIRCVYLGSIKKRSFSSRSSFCSGVLPGSWSSASLSSPDFRRSASLKTRLAWSYEGMSWAWKKLRFNFRSSYSPFSSLSWERSSWSVTSRRDTRPSPLQQPDPISFFFHSRTEKSNLQQISPTKTVPMNNH